MNLYLFGGAEIDNPTRSVSILKILIKKTILQIKPKSVLHIPFARLQSFPEDKGEWDEGWLKDLFIDTEIEILDARKQIDIKRAIDSVIFINGGPERKVLVDTILNNTLLFNLILNSKNIVAESAGSMAMGEYMRISREDDGVMKSLGILKNVIIEPHYTERNYKRFLLGDLQKSGMKYGIGIDSATGIITNPLEFPEKWKKIGEGNVYIKTY